MGASEPSGMEPRRKRCFRGWTYEKEDVVKTWYNAFLFSPIFKLGVGLYSKGASIGGIIFIERYTRMPVTHG